MDLNLFVGRFISSISAVVRAASRRAIFGDSMLFLSLSPTMSLSACVVSLIAKQMKPFSLLSPRICSIQIPLSTPIKHSIPATDQRKAENNVVSRTGMRTRRTKRATTKITCHLIIPLTGFVIIITRTQSPAHTTVNGASGEWSKHIYFPSFRARFDSFGLCFNDASRLRSFGSRQTRTKPTETSIINSSFFFGLSASLCTASQ